MCRHALHWSSKVSWGKKSDGQGSFGWCISTVAASNGLVNSYQLAESFAFHSYRAKLEGSASQESQLGAELEALHAQLAAAQASAARTAALEEEVEALRQQLLAALAAEPAAAEHAEHATAQQAAELEALRRQLEQQLAEQQQAGAEAAALLAQRDAELAELHRQLAAKEAQAGHVEAAEDTRAEVQALRQLLEQQEASIGALQVLNLTIAGWNGSS